MASGSLSRSASVMRMGGVCSLCCSSSRAELRIVLLILLKDMPFYQICAFSDTWRGGGQYNRQPCVCCLPLRAPQKHLCINQRLLLLHDGHIEMASSYDACCYHTCAYSRRRKERYFLVVKMAEIGPMMTWRIKNILPISLVIQARINCNAPGKASAR